MAEKNYVVNVKTKLGTIITVRGDSAAELDANIDGYIDRGLSAKIGMLENDVVVHSQAVPLTVPQHDPVALVAETFGATPVAPPQTFAPVPPPAATAPVATGAKTCPHGPMVARQGSGAKGPWKGWMCPTPKGTPGQCEPVWLNRSMPEWNEFPAQ